MIKFYAKDSHLEVRIQSKINTTKNNFIFYWNCDDPCYAILLKEHFEKVMSDEISRIRREQYELGWKEAKSKKVAKRTWFSGWW